MKKPILNLDQRDQIRFDTFQGAKLLVFLARKKLSRDIYRDKGWVVMKIFDYLLNRVKLRTEWKNK